eukprot:7712440-Pyramimonas_sp.AAC.1
MPRRGRRTRKSLGRRRRWTDPWRGGPAWVLGCGEGLTWAMGASHAPCVDYMRAIFARGAPQREDPVATP